MPSETSRRSPVLRRVLVYEGSSDDLDYTDCRSVPIGSSVTVGRRDADVLVAVRHPNGGISRVAALVTATTSGWDVALHNRNGVVIHPWAQPVPPTGSAASLAWPRVGIRLLHHMEGQQHWLLLEAPDLDAAIPGVTADGTESLETDLAGRPRPVTDKQLQALGTVFTDHLAWPPRHPAVPIPLKAAARKLELSLRGLQERLIESRRKAERLGHGGSADLNDPGYLHTLVRNGMVRFPPPIQVDEQVVRRSG